jgi:hypothetical protein
MNREEAVRLATEIVEKMGNHPDLNNRGYKVDGWRTPTVAERAAAIVQIANTLIDPTPTPAMPITVCGWPIGSPVKPTKEQYDYAQAMQGRSSLTTGERNALAQLVRAYEAEE